MYRPTGPREVWAEHLMSNPGSFSTVAGATSDDWLYDAQYSMSPARVTAGQTRTTDGVAYATQPLETSWGDRFYGTLSPAKVTAGATGASRGGQLT